MTGPHPKVVQTVMRHQSISLTMDTYGHLFPGQGADAVARMRSMLTEAGDSLPPRPCGRPEPMTCQLMTLRGAAHGAVRRTRKEAKCCEPMR